MKIQKEDSTFMYKCDYCGKEFEKSTSLAAHLTHCKEFYLKREGNLDNWNKATKVSIEKNTKWHWIEVERICPKCGNTYMTKCCKETSEYLHKYCSRKCANGHSFTEEQKKQISDTTRNTFFKRLLEKNPSKKDILKIKQNLILKLLCIIKYYLLEDENKYCKICKKLKTFKQFSNNRATCGNQKCVQRLVIETAKINGKYCIKGTYTRDKLKDENGNWCEDSLKTIYKYYFIYKTTNLINGKYYIGMHATNNFNDEYLGSGKALTKAIEKYGKENFKREELEYFTCYKDLVLAEQRYITDEIINDPNSYNLLIGGLGGPAFKGKTFNEESKRKISEKVKISNKIRYDKIYNDYKEQILNSHIDLLQNDCIEKLSQYMNISQYIVLKAIKLYINDFKNILNNNLWNKINDFKKYLRTIK